MAANSATVNDKLKIVHVFRAPLGGLFRHVVDLAAAQRAREHDVGMFFDGDGLCPRVREALARIPGGLTLGVATTPIHRNPAFSDVAAMARFVAFLERVKPDIVHGHGSKGGVYARLSALAPLSGRPIRAYTPHGGSFNYRPGTPLHRAYMFAEKLMAPLTDVFLFESAYIAGRFDALVGARAGVRRVVANGLSPAEFAPAQPNADAADLLYVGELRAAKGIDTLLDALALIGCRSGAVPHTVLIGSGPDKAALSEHARELDVDAFVSFHGQTPTREAFKLGRILVVPSRAESMPYIVLEAAAAGVPMVATGVGGIPEIFGPFRDRLGPADDATNLALRLMAAIEAPAEKLRAEAAELSRHVADNFSIETMVNAVMSGYREALARRRPTPAAAPGATAPSPHP
jgi:glycosyltransferase involved in cell wall biosynthesis